ncbi:MAG: flavodoxin domain-containing protein [Candidatus Limivicinus sp.]|nr:flavodoxin domain-containing protein [Candidatus Limivicinus sp.]
MKPTAIVYTSNTGHTRQYALLLGEQISLPAYSLDEANSQLPGGSPVIYLGWLHASHVKGYPKASKRFALCAVCGVGLCDTGTLTSEVRKATSIPESIPLFTLQGGIDRSRLKGMDKLMISMLTKGLAAKKQRSAQDERMLELLSGDESFVSPENLSEVLQWYREEKL